MSSKDFITYEQALALKELGFDEPCIAFGYLYEGIERFLISTVYNTNSSWLTSEDRSFISRPTYSQAFRWLYQKLDIEKGTMPLDTESQELLLKELIDKVSSKHLLV